MTETRLLTVIHLLYEQNDVDQRELAAQLEAQMKRAYRETMTEQARQIGYPRVRGNDPRGEDLADIRRQAQLDAQSITQTWNRDVRREIYRLYLANPRGNRYYYFSNLERWAAERARWKDAQIALMTDGYAANLAKSSFVKNNNLIARWRMTGPAPKEAVCAELMAIGEVEQDIVDANPTPIHINCPHIWQLVGYSGGLPEKLFVG